MAGLLGSLHSASSGMRANQTVIQTINHNITNMNTPGYTRQRAELSANRAYAKPGRNTSTVYAGQIGQGASVSNITRIRNSFYDHQYRTESHSYGNAAIKYDQFNNIENVFNEPSDTSISTTLNNFFDSFNELSKNPDSVSAKKYLVENAQLLTNVLNQTVQKLDNLKTNIATQEETIINDVNRILDELKILEKEIKVVEATGKNPNDLLDRKDYLIDELSFKVNINNTDVQNALSDGKLTPDEIANIDVSGELQATKDMQKEIDAISKKMETFMNSFATKISDIYTQAQSPQNAAPLFKIERDANGLPKISMNQRFIDDPSSLNMTADLALELSSLKSLKVNINGEAVTLGNFYNSIVQDIGYKTQSISRELSNRESLMVNIENSKASVSGVSLDEEMISLMQFQHAYNATAKVASTIDSLLDVVINGIIK